MIVVDASVALKWLVPEDDSSTAEPYIGPETHAPDFIITECANALWKKVRKGEIKAVEGLNGIGTLPGFVRVHPSSGLVAPAYVIAAELDHPVYDCLYLALAEEFDCRLLTADVRFLKVCAASRYRERVIPL